MIDGVKALVARSRCDEPATDTMIVTFFGQGCFIEGMSAFSGLGGR